ncbi:Stress response protein nst1 [Microbotryomycetes sp. JL201]|nr:Stress response protein nst1 [Microbotryomycetes sp. JL201]
MSTGQARASATPPGAAHAATTPSHVPAQAAKKKKNKKKKTKAQAAAQRAHAGAYDDDEDDDDDEPPLDHQHQQQHQATLDPNASIGQYANTTPSDLLTTASDLYRQIEAAAASALSNHPSFAASFPPPPSSGGNNGQQQQQQQQQAQAHAVHGQGPTAADEAYWTSLPQHLRQFIRSALPLAAGLTSTGPNGQPLSAGQLGNVISGVNGHPLTPLTQDQLSNAAAQLAQVVQSNWGQLGLGPMPTSFANPNVGGGANAANARSTTTTNPNGATISLGSFPVSMPTREQMEAAIGSLGGEFGLAQQGLSLGQQQPQQTQAQQQQTQRGPDDTEDDEPNQAIESTSAKKKNKKKKKKTGQANGQPDPLTTDTPINPNAHATAPNRDAPANPTKVAVPVKAILPSSQLKSTGKPSGTLTKQPSAQPEAGPSSEREKIRDFWLGLKEQERRDLVKVEKEAVLKKMKEQQRNGCSCAVCGRKRSAIEEELEVLYDAYYEELESYALHQQQYASDPSAIEPPPGPGPFPGSVDATADAATTPVQPAKKGGIVRSTRDHKNVRPASGAGAKKRSGTNAGANHHHHEPAHGEPGHTHSPSCPHHPHNHGTPPTAQAKAKGAVIDEPYDDDEIEDDQDDEEEYDEDDYDDEEDEEEYDDDDDLPPEDGAQSKRDDGEFFGFGKSLTVKGGILTVADDLLKNDGQKFLEMMEQLADKRIQREREANEIADDEDGSEEDYDDEEDDEYDDEDDEDEDDELTEAERMEGGRRMFQVFAARMFEQRVLQAYREKVAAERQLQLLREIEAEERLAEEREAKKAKEAQKKKDKKRQEEERMRKEAEREAAERAAREAEEARLEEDRRRNEEQRLKREAERRAKEEEKARREEKARQAKEKERVEKEEKARLAKEARLAAEREAKEKKAREEAERKAREEAERKAREAERKEREEREERERQAKVEEAARVQAAAQAKLQQQQSAQKAAAAQQRASAAAAAAPQPAKAIPGLPKATAPKGATTGNVPAQGARPSNAPPGLPRQPSISTTAASTSQSRGTPGVSQPPAVPAPQPRRASASPATALTSPPTSQQSSRLFSPPPSSQPPMLGVQPQSSFMGAPKPSPHLGPTHISPLLNRSSPIGPPPAPLVNGIGSGQMPRQNGVSMQSSVSPIGVPPPTSSSSSSHAGSHPTSPRPANVGPIGGIIGRPTSTVSSQRSVSPPPRVLGSSALLEDDEIVPSSSQRRQPSAESLPVAAAAPTSGAAPATLSSPPAMSVPIAATSAPQPSGGQTAPSDWSSPFSNGIWGVPALAQPVITPDRNSVIRDRARVSYLKLDELSNGTNAPIAIGDIHRALITLWPDSVSVDLKELVTAMLMEPTVVNGGGSFTFTQRGDGLFAQFNG